MATNGPFPEAYSGLGMNGLKVVSATCCENKLMEMKPRNVRNMQVLIFIYSNIKIQFVNLIRSSLIFQLRGLLIKFILIIYSETANYLIYFYKSIM